MRYSTAATAAFAASAAAQASNATLCDKYTMALLGNVTAKNEATILTLLVNTVVIGNYTKPTIPNVTFPNIKVPGILAKGNVGGTDVNLLPYFNGQLLSSNRGGSSGVSVNFLDGGGATPLMQNMPANGTSSNQYKLLTHLYQLFGVLLGCSTQMDGGDFSTYKGQPSQYEVHKFMDLSSAEFTYFVQQVGLAASSFGVSDADVTAVANALNSTFGYKCAAAATVVKAQGAALQAICVGDGCPLASGAASQSCPYAAPVRPAAVSASSGASMTMTATGVSMTGSATSMTITSTAASGATTSSAAAASTSSVSRADAAGRNAGGAVAAGLAAMAFLL